MQLAHNGIKTHLHQLHTAWQKETEKEGRGGKAPGNSDFTTGRTAQIKGASCHQQGPATAPQGAA